MPAQPLLERFNWSLAEAVSIRRAAATGDGIFVFAGLSFDPALVQPTEIPLTIGHRWHRKIAELDCLYSEQPSNDPLRFALERHNFATTFPRHKTSLSIAVGP
jgi:hypothetical protein